MLMGKGHKIIIICGVLECDARLAHRVPTIGWDQKCSGCFRALLILQSR
jgi:hypothetical protein